jgi:Ca2+/Na+ antiporter
VRPAAFQRSFLVFDTPFLLFVSILFVPFFASGKRFSRIEGGIALALYCAYLAALFLGWEWTPG